jgi:protein SCO1/2
VIVAGKVITVGKAALGGPWVLTDHNGVPVTDASYRGNFLLLYFGFTHCPDICPSELVKVGHVMEELGKLSYTISFYIYYTDM